ncbi:hypothetical protein BDL97_03G047900 [Sphagnum fallax]|nr:hypothetical protein BDL97_03G047900 [Sphagnum fallax]
MPDYNEFFCYVPRGWPMWTPPPVPAAPAGFKWQLVEAKKEEKKAEVKKEEKKKEKPPEIVLTVPMCCEKCEEKVKERILDVHGVTEVKTDRQNSKVTVIGKADKSQVLKKAKKFDCRAKILEVKKAEVAEKKVEEKKKEEHPKKKEEPNTTWTNDPRNFYPTYCLPYCYPYPYPAPPFEADGTYRPSQAYPPHYYPYLETDYSYYNYPNNPHYLTHIRYS